MNFCAAVGNAVLVRGEKRWGGAGLLAKMLALCLSGASWLGWSSCRTSPWGCCASASVFGTWVLHVNRIQEEFGPAITRSPPSSEETSLQGTDSCCS